MAHRPRAAAASSAVETTPSPSVRIGTSGYDYPEWKGRFYPVELAASKRLAWYAEHFTAVEINATFYRMPTAKTVAGWAAGTPPGFTFVLKVPQRITHFARLVDVAGPLGYFCETARGLGPRLGPLLFQLPPTFPKHADRLGAALDLVPRDLRCAVEVRHASWLADDVYALLRRRNAALCIADSGTASTPRVPTADWGYLRLRDEGYTDADLARWAETIRTLGGAWRDAFVFFKHEEAGTGPALARRLGELLA